MITIGTLAKVYGQLPSQIAGNATTYDLMIYDVMIAWEEHQDRKANGSVPQMSQEDLMKILKETKG